MAQHTIERALYLGGLHARVESAEHVSEEESHGSISRQRVDDRDERDVARAHADAGAHRRSGSARRAGRPRAHGAEAAPHRRGREQGPLRAGLPRRVHPGHRVGVRHVHGPAVPLHLVQGRHPLPDAPAQPGAVAPAPGRRRLRADDRPDREARARAADLDEVPVREPRHDPVPLHREQVPGRRAPPPGPRARRQERRRVLPSPALRDPRRTARGQGRPRGQPGRIHLRLPRPPRLEP